MSTIIGAARPTGASIAFYVGKDLTADGTVMVGGYGDEPSSHWLRIMPGREHAEGATMTVGVTEEASYPGELFEIPQVRRTHRYIATLYSEFAGFPAPLTNGGLNEKLVAARDVWSPSRPELREMTPEPQRGLSYSDLSRIVMERADSAREAVEIVGRLIERHGFATYGGNSHLFADPEEGWVLIEFAGGEGLWVAERLGSGEVRVSHPGYILEIPRNYQEHPDYMGSENLISFAVKQGWYDPDSGEPFNVNEVYGNGEGRAELVERFENRLREWAPEVGLQDMMRIVRTPETTDDRSGYGQVVRLRDDLENTELATLWAAAASPVTAPFLPYRLGVRRVPPEYRRHRYLTGGEAARFMDPAHRGLESTRYAFRVYKRLYYLTAEHREKFLPEVTEALEALERRWIEEQDAVERTARTLYEAGETDLARRYLTRYSQAESMRALDVAKALAASIEARTKLLFGIQQPDEK